MRELVFLLEGQSEREMLNGVIPRLLPGVHYRCIAFKGKQDLERQIVWRIREYINPQARFIILRDKDSDDCKIVKQRLLDKCRKTGREVLVRIACHEIESWYLADLAAVEKGLRISNLARHQNKSKFRKPDSTKSPKQELRRLTDDRYQEMGGSRAIGPHLSLDNKRSCSFAVFMAGVRKMAEIAP